MLYKAIATYQMVVASMVLPFCQMKLVAFELRERRPGKVEACPGRGQAQGNRI